jgi:hypothetical protein
MCQDPGPMADDEIPAAPPSTSRGTKVRHVFAAVVALGLAAVWLASSLGALKVCRDSLASVGSAAVVRMCGPLGLIELLPWTLLLVLLMWPDLSEVSVPGLISLKRRVAEQEKRQERLEIAIQAVQQNVNLSPHQEITVMLSPDWHRAEQELSQKANQFQAGQEVRKPPPRDVKEPRAAGQGDLEVRLLAVWEQIDRNIRASQPPRRVPYPFFDLPPHLTEYQQAIVRDWLEAFGTEMALVRAARNSIAHPPHDLSPADISEALHIGERLLNILDKRLSTDPLARGTQSTPPTRASEGSSNKAGTRRPGAPSL